MNYRVKWEGYSRSEATWEPYDQLVKDGCLPKIREYEKSLKAEDEPKKPVVPSITWPSSTVSEEYILSSDGDEKGSIDSSFLDDIGCDERFHFSTRPQAFQIEYGRFYD